MDLLKTTLSIKKTPTIAKITISHANPIQIYTPHTEIRQRIVRTLMCHQEIVKVDNKEAIPIHWKLHSRLLSTFHIMCAKKYLQLLPKMTNATKNQTKLKLLLSRFTIFLHFRLFFLFAYSFTSSFTYKHTHTFFINNTLFTILLPMVLFCTFYFEFIFKVVDQ